MSNFHLSSIVTMKDISITLFGIILGIVIQYSIDRLKSLKKRKVLKKLEDIFISSKKGDPTNTQAVITIKSKKDSENIIEFSALSLVSSDYSGFIEIMESNSGSGKYYHVPEIINGLEYVGFGKIDVIIQANTILAEQTYQANNKQEQNPEVWRKIEGDDLGKTAEELRDKYRKIKDERIIPLRFINL